MRGADARSRPGGHPRGRDRVDRVGVAQASPGLLEVGLEQEGELAAALRALGVQRLELGQPDAGRRPPVRQHPEAELGGEPGVAGHVPCVEQPQRGAQVAARHLTALARGAHRVVETGARVPDRVPDPVGQHGDVRPPRVQEQHVEIAAGQQLTAAVAADGHQRHAGLVAEQRSQPAVGLGGTPGTVGAEGGGPPSRHGVARAWAAAVRAPPGRVHRCAPARQRPPVRTRPCRPRSGRSAPP